MHRKPKIDEVYIDSRELPSPHVYGLMRAGPLPPPKEEPVKDAPLYQLRDDQVASAKACAVIAGFFALAALALLIKSYR